MKEKKIPYIQKMTAVALLIVGVAFAVFQTLLVFNYYDTSIYLYDHGTPLPVIFNITLSVFVILALALFGIFKKDSHPDEAPRVTVISSIFSLLCGFTALSCGIFGFLEHIEKTKNIMYIPEKQDNFIFWASIASVLAFGYFIVNAFVKKATTLKGWLGCGAIAWYILYLLGVYFDMTTPLNSPVRLINEFALVGAMIYLVVELRLTLDIPKKGFYISASVIAFTLLLSSSVSNLVGVIGGRLTADDYFICYIHQLVMAGYILTRLISRLVQRQKISNSNN